MGEEQSSGAAWHVLHVRSRCEKKVAEFCASSGLPHYLPLRMAHRVYQRRKVRVELPVFPGYIFAAYQPEQRVDVLRSNVVVNILPVTDQGRFLHDLDQVRQALAVDATLGACAAFTRGRAVRIISGPFAGIEGVVHAVRSDTRVVLNVEMIGQAVAVEAEMDALEPLDP